MKPLTKKLKFFLFLALKMHVQLKFHPAALKEQLKEKKITRCGKCSVLLRVEKRILIRLSSPTADPPHSNVQEVRAARPEQTFHVSEFRIWIFFTPVGSGSKLCKAVKKVPTKFKASSNFL